MNERDTTLRQKECRDLQRELRTPSPRKPTTKSNTSRHAWKAAEAEHRRGQRRRQLLARYLFGDDYTAKVDAINEGVANESHIREWDDMKATWDGWRETGFAEWLNGMPSPVWMNAVPDLDCPPDSDPNEYNKFVVDALRKAFPARAPKTFNRIHG